MALRRDLAKRLVHLSHPIPPSAVGFAPHRSHLTSSDTSNRGFFRRFLQPRTINQSSSPTSARPPQFLTLPVGERLREKLSDVTGVSGDRIRLARPPVTGSLTAEDAKRILKAAQMEEVKRRLSSAPEPTLPYPENQALEIATALDDSATVIFGNPHIVVLAQLK